MKKIFCLDTNVLLYDPAALFAFDDNEVVIPLIVLEELDDKKTRQDDVGANARHVNRTLDDFRKIGNLNDGVRLPSGGLLKVIESTDPSILPTGLRPRGADNSIIATALQLIRTGGNVILITKDINARVKCDYLKIPCADYLKHQVAKHKSSLYQGVRRATVPEERLESFYMSGSLTLLPQEVEEKKLHPNEFVVMKSDPAKKSAIARCQNIPEKVKPLIEIAAVWGLKPRNKEQRFAIDLLFDDSINLVSLVGPAGTGKTLLAVAMGLQKVLGESKYDKLIISRPVQPLGNDIGYLPGTLEEKMLPWIQPVMDNLKFLFSADKDKKNASTMNLYFEKGIIEVEALTYIRGRSISRAFMIIDEAQNLSVHELKTIITRAGENTKIVLTGDLEQIDNNYVDSLSNGLTYAVEKFKDYPLAGHVSLIKGVRSKLATLASKIL